MNYYRVRTEEQVSTPTGKKVYKRTEIFLARDSQCILEDCLRRFGEHLLSMDAQEISEKRVKKDTKVYVV